MSDHSNRSLFQFSCHEATRSITTPTWLRWWSIARLPPSISTGSPDKLTNEHYIQGGGEQFNTVSCSMVRKMEEALGGWVTWLEYWLYVIQSVALIMDFSLQMQRFNESLMATLLYLLNNPESRLYVRSDVGLEVLKVYQLCMIIQFIYLIFFQIV